MGNYKYYSGKTAKSWSNIKRTPTGIMVHHWGRDGQKIENVVDWFVRLAKTSAHYVVAGGVVYCLVAPGRVAWHAGVWLRNLSHVGIECRPEMSEADFETAAQLIADLRKVYGPLPLHPHKKWRNTACPGRWDAGDTLARLSRRADDILKGVAPASKETVHIVKKNETVWGIARKYGLTVNQVSELNRALNVSTIFPGQRLRVK